MKAPVLALCAAVVIGWMIATLPGHGQGRPGMRTAHESRLLQVTFEAGSAVLSGESRAALAGLAVTLSADPGMRITVKAYTSTGTSISETRRLSLQRALAVREYLGGQGIAAVRMDLLPLGRSPDEGPRDRVDILRADRNEKL
jgi:outer membrane protein OmpA-like peptidoglycan-associated protein